MSSLTLRRTLSILELLVAHPRGLPLKVISSHLDIPPSAVHRMLSELCDTGYVRQSRSQGDYALTTRLVSMGLSVLGSTGLVDVAQPLLNRLAEISGELVRLAVIDGDAMTWVAKAQGARGGLRYDPEMGAETALAFTASGQAWLLTLDDERVCELVSPQRLGRAGTFGPNAPATLDALRRQLRAARARGFSVTVETFAAGMTAIGAPVRRPGEPAIGTISVAGPSVRFTEARALSLGPQLLATAAELAMASRVSPLFNPPSRHPEPAVIQHD